MKSKLDWNTDRNLEGQAHIKLVDEFGFWRAEVSIAVFWELMIYVQNTYLFLPTTWRCPVMQISTRINSRHHSKDTGVAPLQRNETINIWRELPDHSSEEKIVSKCFTS